MMRRPKKVRFDSWEECEEFITEIEYEHELNVSQPVIFRGQSDADWGLTTTLERYTKGYSYFREYLKLCRRVKSEIEAYTGNMWDEIDILDIMKTGSNYDAFSRGYLPAYDFIAYLRHHGFPSPLLDWSRSAYVAAYFAFAGASMDKDVAIYIYSERPHDTKIGSSDHPTIHVRGEYVRAPRRHFRQRSCYTTCAAFDNTNEWKFVSHDLVLKESNEVQDVLWKVSLPGKLKVYVLRILDKHNLNSFSLFEDEDNLMKTLALREIDLRRPQIFDPHIVGPGGSIPSA